MNNQKTESDSDTYSCNYIDNKIEQRTGCMTAYANIYNFTGTIAAFGTLKISLNTAIKNTNKLELTEDGGIKIKAGISKIKVSGQCAVYRGKTGGYGVRILKNNDIVVSGDGNFSDWQVSSYTITNRIIEVAENDVIYLYMKSNNDAESSVSLTDASKYLWLTVEVVE